MEGFHTEPDNRNTEFATDPHRDYETLCAEFMTYRLKLREFIRTVGDYTLIPGAALSLGDSSTFHFSDPANPYYRYIKETYGTNVVTASTHISVGVEDAETLIRAYRVIRCEAALFLALSATSPFLDGEITGYHSVRWHRFPQTPENVPMFADHASYCAWIDEQMASGAMQNIRHLWLSARPNGDNAPHDLNRLELRVCDRIADPAFLWGVTALLEARIQQILAEPDLDPFVMTETEPGGLKATALANEAEASRHSLDARLTRWSDGKLLPVRDWLAGYIEEVRPYAKAAGFACHLKGLDLVLEQGSVAQQWLAKCKAGASVETVLRDAIEEAEARDYAFRCGCVETDEA